VRARRAPGTPPTRIVRPRSVTTDRSERGSWPSWKRFAPRRRRRSAAVANGRDARLDGRLLRDPRHSARATALPAALRSGQRQPRGLAERGFDGPKIAVINGLVKANAMLFTGLRVRQARPAVGQALPRHGSAFARHVSRPEAPGAQFDLRSRSAGPSAALRIGPRTRSPGRGRRSRPPDPPRPELSPNCPAGAIRWPAPAARRPCRARRTAQRSIPRRPLAASSPGPVAGQGNVAAGRRAAEHGLERIRPAPRAYRRSRRAGRSSAGRWRIAAIRRQRCGERRERHAAADEVSAASPWYDRAVLPNDDDGPALALA
jgi:hypothetical protein